jgi:hypothetical protein
MIYFIIILLVISIIINLLISNSINDDFTDTDKLYYIYHTKENHKDFDIIWDNIETEVKNNHFYYKFITVKATEVDSITKENRINIFPTILYKTKDGFYRIYKGKLRDAKAILDWANN